MSLPLALRYEVRVVRERLRPLAATIHVRESGAVAELVRPIFKGLDVEQVWAIALDSKNGIVGSVLISQGSKTSSLVHPREVFSPLMMLRAAGFILAHNHPSGDPEPSPDDEALTRRIIAAGELLGIPLLDHVVIGDEGSYVSFLERGAIPQKGR